MTAATGRRIAAVGAALALVALVPLSATAQAGRCPRFVDASRGLPQEGMWQTHPALGDVDGDGRLDLVATPFRGIGPKIWLNRAQEDGLVWEPTPSRPKGSGRSCGFGVRLADVNGDGHLDLGVADQCSGVRIFLGDGQGGFQRLDLPQLSSPRTGAQDLDFADLDNDGHLDVVAVATSRHGFLVFFGDGQGGFEPRDVGLPREGRGSAIALGDIDGDGRVDVASSYTRSTEAMRRLDSHRLQEPVWIQGEEGFEPSSTFLPNPATYRALALADFDGDGRLDLAISGEDWKDFPPLVAYRADGHGRWIPGPRSHPTLQGDDRQYEGVAFEDFDGNGTLDLAAVNHLSAGVEIWLNDGTGIWTACPSDGLPTALGDELGPGWRMTTGDVDGDGLPDIAVGFGSLERGALRVWVQQPPSKKGTNVPSGATRSGAKKPGGSGSGGGAGSADGDGA